jgi:hypothetical protein
MYRSTLQFWDEIIKIAVPISSRESEASLQHVSTGFLPDPDNPDHVHLVATFRLVIWHVEDGQRWVENIKEQEVFLAPLGNEDDVCAYLEAWGNTLDTLLSGETTLHAAMPSDLTHFKVHPMTLKGKGVEAYETALRQRSRLGRWIF